MGEPHRVEVIDSRYDLLEDAIDLGTGHATAHNDGEQIEFGILHHLVIVAMI